MKKSGYQKLKEENRLLKEDINSLMGANGIARKVLTEIKYKSISQIEKMFWIGDSKNDILRKNT